ncbi:MAG: IS66 family insertion sequence element accessory protein TnpB [Methyloglobulus sp.]|nr:IS66 family insertion sequence element accessory protein TnpB [Methyloglobulus sp.]
MPVNKEWRTHIETWQGSSLRQVYCRQHQLNYKSFIIRLSEYRKTWDDDKPVTLSNESIKSPTQTRSLVLRLKQGTDWVTGNDIGAVAVDITARACLIGELTQI